MVDVEAGQLGTTERGHEAQRQDDRIPLTVTSSTFACAEADARYILHGHPGGEVSVAGFDVTGAELQATGAILADISQEVRTEVAALQAQVEALLGGSWQGQSASGFAQGWEQWRGGANDVLAALAAMARLLGTTGQDYQVSEDGSTRTVNQSGAGL
ncbi:MAG: hypothetical protein DLM61_07040 [Pseudonocardiales bacterium]|nr:MAG: hypothetical protein DLM61_07040 [Pseudonocardiales bacterium]